MAAAQRELIVRVIHESGWWNQVMTVLTAKGTNSHNVANRLRMLAAAGIIDADMTAEQVIQQHGRYETAKLLHLLAGEKADRAREQACQDVLEAEQQPAAQDFQCPDPVLEMVEQHWLIMLIISIIFIYIVRKI